MTPAPDLQQMLRGAALRVTRPRLAVLGCHVLLDPGNAPALVFDIGGGSTELVWIDLSDVEPALLAKINGCTMVAASAAMVLGIKPRTAATILALQLVPTTLADHPFWNYEGDARAQQIDEFVRNVGYAGGLLAIATAAKKSKKK